jgi:hypothetical protein
MAQMASEASSDLIRGSLSINVDHDTAVTQIHPVHAVKEEGWKMVY